MDTTTKYYYGKGKRKTATAKVRLYEKGSGKILINDKLMNKYIPTKELEDLVLSPLVLTGNPKTFDLSIHVNGGGFSSQCEAMRHGISKALLEFNIELRGTLKKEGFLTRDSRMKERKKPGLKRARRAPQFSKR
jgi:small subunit ribosomal protein S9